MDERAAVAWLHRRTGLGLSPDELDAARARGIGPELDRMAVSDGATDPWAGLDVPVDPMATRAERVKVIGAWIDHLATTTTPLLDRLAWTLHGWLVSSMDKVRSPAQMVGQIQILRAQGTGRFPDLLRAVATDPAMLFYLDGRDSTAAAPNENFSRELMELFSLGVGAYTEADVKAGARALTGWTVGRSDTRSSFRPRRHDDTPQRYLGQATVSDVDQVIAAVVAQPAHPAFVARRLAKEVLGTTDSSTVGAVAAAYEAGDRRLDAAVMAAARLGVAGDPAPVVLAPVPWLAMARRVHRRRPPDRGGRRGACGQPARSRCSPRTWPDGPTVRPGSPAPPSWPGPTSPRRWPAPRPRGTRPSPPPSPATSTPSPTASGCPTPVSATRPRPPSRTSATPGPGSPSPSPAPRW